MAKNNKNFWFALIEHCQKYKDSVRLWNGYVGWKVREELKKENPRVILEAPPGDWPKLKEIEKTNLEELTDYFGGLPSWDKQSYMDFSGTEFKTGIDFSDLTFVAVDFSKATFSSWVIFKGTRFLKFSDFNQAVFQYIVHFDGAYFESSVDFSKTEFEENSRFRNVQFERGAVFSESTFHMRTKFDRSKFSNAIFSDKAIDDCLAGFNKVEFMDNVSFRKVIFGEDPNQMPENSRQDLVADFSDAKFHASTDFGNAVFNSVPHFFNCSLHEDTDFSDVEWPEAMPTEPKQIKVAIRAWERLELIMSKLERPLERHHFFRRKMQTRRLTEGRFMRMVNRLFEFTCDYGWSVSRAACWWIGHWLVAAGVLFLNANREIFHVGILKLLLASLGTAFTNAHAFLGLTGVGGYLESSRELIKACDQIGLFATVGVLQAVLGPVFLFLLLLTLRNRFRLT